MKKPIAPNAEQLRLQLQEVTITRPGRIWLPGAELAAPRLDPSRWSSRPAASPEWARQDSWIRRQRLN